jgi:hypothetical protein
MDSVTGMGSLGEGEGQDTAVASLELCGLALRFIEVAAITVSG